MTEKLTQLRSGLNVDQHLELIGPTNSTPHLQLSIYLSQVQYVTRAQPPHVVAQEARVIAQVLAVLAARVEVRNSVNESDNG